MRPSREREQTLLADWFNAVHYDGELPDWTEADPGDDEDEAVVAGARPVDGDGDGFVYDGTPRQRPWNPLTDASYPDGKIPEVVRKRQSVARQKARTSPFTPVDQSGELGGAATVPASPVKLTTKINTLTPDFTPEQSEKFAAFLTRQTGMTQYASDKYLPTNVRGFAQGYSTREWLDPLFTSDSPDPDAVALVQAWRKALVDHIGEKGGDAAILHRGVIDKDTDPFVPKRTPHWSDQYNDVRPQPRDAEIAGITSWTSVKTQAKEFGGHNVTRDVPVDQLIGRFGSIAGEVLVADDPLVTRALDAWPNDVDGVPAAPFGTFPERYELAQGAVPETSTDIAFYEVGGAVRDDVMGIPTDDVDFAVTAPSYEAMKAHLEGQGFRIFQEREEFATIKAKVPDGHPLQKRTLVADFVLARRDGPSSDGRRPDYTEPGSLEDDLARRDFTVNAIAKDIDGNIIDPHNGLADIETRTLRFVGDPMARVNEDGLRVLRGFRFMVTKQLTPDPETWRALTSDVAVERLAGVSDNRVAKELDKMLAYDTPGAVHLLGQLPPKMLDAIFRDGMRLTSNQKKVKGLTRDLDLPRNPFIPTGDGESVIELGSGPEGWQRIPEPPGPAIPIQRDGLPSRDIAGWTRPTSDQLAEAFNFELPNGYKVTAPAIRVTRSQVDAKIVGPDGKQVGRMTWQIREASPTAYLFSISINRGQQGNGIGAQVFARSVDNLRALGIDTVEALALSDDNHNGAYTWARAGFDWEPGDWSISELGEKLNAVSWDRVGEYPEADLLEARRIGRQLAAIDELPYDPEDYPETLPTPNDIAMIGWTPGAESWLGRDFLSGELVPEDDRLGSVVWSGVMRIGAAPSSPFATTDAPVELGSASSVPTADVELSSIVRTGNPHRWLGSGLSGERRYYSSGDLSKRTVNARVAAVKKLMAEELPQLKGKKFEIRYWTDWDEYKANVAYNAQTGSYPLAGWRPTGGSDGGPAIVVSPSIATRWFDNDPGLAGDWKVLLHELVHAASPQRVSNSGAEAVLEEGMAEVISTDIAVRRLADARVPIEQPSWNGGGITPGVEALVRGGTYREQVAQLILHAADEVGEWDRGRIMAKMREWWDDGEYTSKYRRYELRGDGRSREEEIAKRTAETDAHYDRLIAQLPQHAEQYEAERRSMNEYHQTLTTTGNWQAEAVVNWRRMVASAEAAGVPIRRIRHTYDDSDFEFSAPSGGRSPADEAEVDTVSSSLLYWLLNGEAVDAAAAPVAPAGGEGAVVVP
jgi:hypothetical protein